MPPIATMNAYTTLIDVPALQALQAAGAPLVILDCGFDLSDPGLGERDFASAHLPGAHFAHLERDLSGPKSPEGPRSPRFTGRHPLPDRGALARWAGSVGIRPGVQVVAYDRQGLPYAARAWWLLRWLGHAEVAVLDGGWAAWLEAGLPTPATVNPPVPAGPYPLASAAGAMPVIEADALLGSLEQVQVVDARAAERFRGEVEPLDPVGGHIPGAKQRFFKDNLDATGRFKPAEALRAAFLAVGGSDPSRVVHQCGSGVTACHNLLAMTHAGLAGSVLYPGSWSQWCADPARPVSKG